MGSSSENNQIVMYQGDRWSGPLYRCPMCNEGSMHKDKLSRMITGTKYFTYRCDKCNFEDYKED